MKRLLPFIFLLVTCFPAWAVPVFEQGLVLSGSGVTSVSFSVTTSGSNRFMLMCPSWNDSAITVSSLTYNSVGATSVTSVNNTNNILSSMYRRSLGTGTTTADVEVIFSGVVDSITLAVMTFTDVDQTTPIGTAVSAGVAGADILATVDVTSAANDLIADCFGAQSALTYSYGSGQSEAYNLDAAGVFTGSTKSGSAGTVTMQRTWDGTYNYYTEIAVPIKEVTAAPGGVARRRPPIFQ